MRQYVVWLHESGYIYASTGNVFFFACAEKCIFEQTGTQADGVVGIWEICMNIALYQRSAVFVFALCP